MKRGMDYDSAHRATLSWQGIPYKRGYEAELYSIEAMKAADGGLTAWSPEAVIKAQSK